jgi:hypothetical protein
MIWVTICFQKRARLEGVSLFLDYFSGTHEETVNEISLNI